MSSISNELPPLGEKTKFSPPKNMDKQVMVALYTSTQGIKGDSKRKRGWKKKVQEQ